MAWWEAHRRPFDGYLSIWQSERGVARIGALAGTVTALYLLGVLVFGRSGIPIALAAPLAAAFGPAGAWGAMLGTIFGELALGRVGFPAVFEAFGVFLAGTVGWAIWLRLAYPYRKNPLTAAVAVVPVTVLGAMLGTVVSLTATTLFLDHGFVAAAPAALTNHLALAVLLGPPIAVVGVHQDEIPVTGMTIEPTQWIMTVALVGAITVAWLLAALSIDVLRTAVRASPHLREEIARRFPPLIDVLAVYASGPRGWTLQFVLAGIAVGLIALAIVTTRHRSRGLGLPNQLARF